MLRNINLQLFAGEDDVILPDDFVAEPQASDNTTATEPVEGTTKTEPVQTQPQEQPKFKVKFNHEEKEIGYDEAIPLVQKGMNYDKVMEQYNSLKSDPSLSFVAAQAQKYGMSPTEYIEAVQKQEEQEQLKSLIQQNIPEQFAREMLENRKFREQIRAEKQTEQQKAQQNAEFEEFLNAYPDVKDTDIPKEVWIMQANGRRLVDAYAFYENQQLKTQLKALQHNEEVAKQTPIGGVSTHGSAEVASKDPFEMGFDSVK